MQKLLDLEFTFNALEIQSAECDYCYLRQEEKGLVDQAFQRASVSLDRKSLSSIYFSGRYFHPCRAAVEIGGCEPKSTRNESLSFSFPPLLPLPLAFHHLFTGVKLDAPPQSRWGISVYHVLFTCTIFISFKLWIRFFFN